MTTRAARSTRGNWWPWAATAAAVAAIAWIVAGYAVQRRQGQGLLPMTDGISLSDPVRAAISAANGAAQAQPASATTIGELGMAYHAAMLAEPAHVAYARAAALDPRDWRWPYYDGLLFAEHGRTDDAARAFAVVTGIVPAHGLAWWAIGEIAFKAGRLEDAAAAFVRARDAAPMPAPAIPGAPARAPASATAHASFGLARIALERGRLEDARAELRRVVAAQPRFGPARALLTQLGTDDAQARNLRAAATTGGLLPVSDPWLDLIVARSSHIDLLLKHASLAARRGDREWREFLARRAIGVEPENRDALLEMAAMLQDSGRHQEALEYLQRCERVSPGDHHVLVEQGRSLTETGRLEEAERVLRRAVRVRDAAAEYNLGNVIDRLDRWDEARGRYERALAIDPFHARALNNLALGLHRRGDTAAARALFARALQAAPGNAETYTNLAGLLIERREFAEAIALLETAVTLAPDAADAQNNLGIALAETGRWAEARAAFEAALAAEPNHPDARRNLAVVAARMAGSPP